MRLYEKEVRRGIAWLGEHHPGWRDKINTATLNLSDCRACILGQMFGDYVKGLRAAGHYVGTGTLSMPEVGDEAAKWAVAHGFAGCYELNREWGRQLQEHGEAQSDDGNRLSESKVLPTPAPESLREERS